MTFLPQQVLSQILWMINPRTTHPTTIETHRNQTQSVFTGWLVTWPELEVTARRSTLVRLQQISWPICRVQSGVAPFCRLATPGITPGFLSCTLVAPVVAEKVMPSQ
jgi:hypothetical protein